MLVLKMVGWTDEFLWEAGFGELRFCSGAVFVEFDELGGSVGFIKPRRPWESIDVEWTSGFDGLTGFSEFDEF